MTMRCDVAVVGAGPTGLTIANLLGQAGLTCVLIERHDETVRQPRAVSIDDESLRTMQAAGLCHEVMADCALDYGSHYYTRSGICFARVEPTTREFGFPRRSAFTQPKLEATLAAALGRFPGVTALFGHVCETFEDNGDAVRLQLRTPSGDAEIVEAGFLIGADGASSAIRKAIGAVLTGETYEQPWLIVDLAATRERLRQTRVVCDPARPFITLPGPGLIRRYEFMLRAGETAESATDAAFVRGLLAASGPDADMPVVRRQVYTFHARIVDCWRRGRVFLAGDAAHLSPPFAGQGMNSGLRDAHNLAWKLAEVIAGRLGDGLLDSYQTEREPHARALVALAIRMGRIMMPTSPVQAWAVQGSLRALRLAPRLKSYFTEMKYKPKPFYRSGFVARPAGVGGGPVGRMVPQPTVEWLDRRRVMLDDVTGNGFALLAYGGDAQAALANAADRDFGLVPGARLAVLPRDCNPDPDGPLLDHTVRDVDGGFGAFLPGKGTTLMLVRPDRYVCAAGDAADLAAATRAMVAACGLPDAAPGPPTAGPTARLELSQG